MRLVKCYFLLFTVSLIASQTCASQTAPVQKEQIALWDAVIAGDVTKAIGSIKAGADVNGLDTREKVAGPNGRRALIPADTLGTELGDDLGSRRRA